MTVPQMAAPSTHGTDANAAYHHAALAAGTQIDDGLELPQHLPEQDSAEISGAQTVDIELDDGEIRDRVTSDLASLGPMSVGRTSRGALVNGVRMPKGTRWEVVDAGHSWGTQETIDFLIRAIDKVHAQFPDTDKMRIGHISARDGGPLKPHKSHQSGRDVDISYYYKQDRPFHWYQRANADNLDVPRTWALVRALLTDTDAEFIFINTSIQRLLKQHAVSIGEDGEWLDDVFQYRRSRTAPRGLGPIIRHAHGHDTHIHVRFYNPRAQELGRRAFSALVDAGRIKPHVYYTRYTARKGDILGRLAKRFGTTVKAIQKANGLRSTRILKGRTYLIPRRGQVEAPGRMVIPPRRLPPGVSGKDGVATAN